MCERLVGRNAHTRSHYVLQNILTGCKFLADFSHVSSSSLESADMVALVSPEQRTSDERWRDTLCEERERSTGLTSTSDPWSGLVLFQAEAKRFTMSGEQPCWSAR